MFGVDAAIALTDHLGIVPDLRFVYGGPAQVGNKYREFGLEPGSRGASDVRPVPDAVRELGGEAIIGEIISLMTIARHLGRDGLLERFRAY